MSIPTLPGITEKTITSARIATRVLFSGADDGIPVLFIHGNASSATFWEETMLALPAGYRAIAHDQRGYGGADRAQKIDATRGMGDLADDAFALLDTLGIQRAHVVGHSLGGAVVWRMMMDAPDRLISVTQAAPGSPYGFGGTKGLDGQLCNPDGAGSGGGIVNANFTQLMVAGERGTDNPQASPRVVMNTFYWKPPFKAAREEELLSSLLSTGRSPRRGNSAPPTRSRRFTRATCRSWRIFRPSRQCCGCAAQMTKLSATIHCSIWEHLARWAQFPVGRAQRSTRRSRWSARPAPC